MRGNESSQRQPAHTRHHVTSITKAAGPPPAIDTRPDQALADNLLRHALVDALGLHHAGVDASAS